MLTASIVIHNTPDKQVRKALECLSRSGIEKVYLLDNGTHPFNATTLPEKPLTDYRRIANRGFGAGHNIALREVIDNNPEGFHLVMNADVEWDGDALSPLMKYMEENPDVGMVQPRIIYGDGVLQYTCRLLPTPLDLFAKRFLPAAIVRKRMERYLLVDHDHHKSLNVAYLQGSFLLIRTLALKECGIFDERFFMYPEDIDLTRRIHTSWKTLYLPLSNVTHYHNATSRRNVKMFAIHLKNMIKYFNKWGWWFDRRRREINHETLSSVVTPPSGKREEGRG